LDVVEILNDAKEALAKTFGPRLRHVIHYGSTCRGDAQVHSDVDFLVVLQGPIQLGEDLDTIIRTLYPIQLQIDAPIHAIPVDETDYDAGEFGLYRSAKRDGVVL